VITKLQFHEALTEAAKVRREYSYSNGGDRCPKTGTNTWQLGTLDGPRGTVSIIRE
jgi:hypothetical protein